LPKRSALVLAALAALVTTAVAGAAAFPVRLVSQTATTVTLGWDAQSGADGYRFYADGKAVSRTFDPSRTSVKFAKGAVQYRVEVLHVSAGDVGTYPAPVQPPPTGASVFLAPSGNDGNPCTAASPCRSMQRGAAAASSGATVSLAAGSYPEQSLVNVQKPVSFKADGAVTFAGQLVLQCNTGVTVDGVKSKMLLVSSGNRDLTIRNADVGGGPWTTGLEEDPVVISGDQYHACSTGFLNRNIVLDGAYIHDYFWHQNPGSGPHPDCLQVYGGVDGLTIRNSRFERCAESFIGSYPDFGDVKNVLIEDTTFTDISETGRGTYFAAQFGCNPANNSFQGTGDGFTLRRTTWKPNALGIDGVGIPVRTDCRHFLVENNTFQYGPEQWACDDWNQRWDDTVVWRNNTFLNGGACTAG